MEQSPSSEANWFSGSQEVPHILWNPRAHNHVNKCPPPAPVLREINPIHALTSHFLKIHLNIILPYMPRSSKWSLSFRFPHQNSVYTSPRPHMCYMHHPSHPSQFDHPNCIGCGILVCVTIDRMCIIEMKSKQDIYCSVSFLTMQSTSGVTVSVKVLVIFILHHNMEVEIPGNIKQLVIQLTTCYFKMWKYG